MSVFALDRSGKPLMPCSEKHARKLLDAHRARVHRLYPFAIRLADRRIEEVAAQGGLQPLRLSLDPGSKTTGLALCRVERQVDALTGELSEPVMHIGFPRGYLMRAKTVQGFRTGGMVRADVPAASKKAGVHTGRVAVRASGSFNVQARAGVVQGVSHKHCRVLARGDGYSYNLVAQTSETGGGASRRALSLPDLKDRVSRAIH